MRILFAGGGTGGHLYPALAIARALVQADSRVEPFFIGARRGIERDVLPTAGFPFELLELHPLYRTRAWNNWRTIVGGMGAWRRIAAVAAASPPAALVATGGYAAGVALAYASRRGIPIAIQEQNSIPGATVRWFAPRAQQIHLGFPEAAQQLRLGPGTELFDSGNPIEPPPSPRLPRSAALALWNLPNAELPVLLVSGASQGAEAINRVVAEWIRQGGAAGVQLIWSTGRAWYDSYASLESPTVRVRPYIAPMADAYAAADFALCRAGAMTTAELFAWGVPPVLVPLPTAAADHQTANARALQQAGAARMILQSELTFERLTRVVGELLGDRGALERMQLVALQRARPNAAHDVAGHVLGMLKLK